MVLPAIVTTLPTPTFLLANVAVALEVDSVTTSLPAIPLKAAEPLFNSAVANVDALYVRLLAVMPVMVRSFAVIDAVVVGWVSV